MNTDIPRYGRSAEETEQYLEKLEHALDEQIERAEADPAQARRFVEAFVVRAGALEKA